MDSTTGDDTQRKLTQKFLDDDVRGWRTTITNIYLDEREYELLAMLGGDEIVKERIVFPSGGRRFSIDVFAGRHEGLVLAETEAASEAELARVDLPVWANAEVTGDVFFTGGSLAMTDMAVIQERIRELGG